jgi:REP element-mobilizing transposase RayT
MKWRAGLQPGRQTEGRQTEGRALARPALGPTPCTSRDAMSRPPKLASDCYVGLRRHFLTCCTRNRVPFFTHTDVVDLVSSAFFATCEAGGVDVLAYCFMPDHLHALVEGRREGAEPCGTLKGHQESSDTSSRIHCGHTWWVAFLTIPIGDHGCTAERS